MNLKLGKDDKKQWVKFYACQIISAIETLQKCNIIYRDIKPENMMIDRDGNIKLIDFGFAKILTP
jgi:serine/threonine protein kinase